MTTREWKVGERCWLVFGGAAERVTFVWMGERGRVALRDAQGFEFGSRANALFATKRDADVALTERQLFSDKIAASKLAGKIDKAEKRLAALRAKGGVK